MSGQPRVLVGMTGVTIGGGIASLSRTATCALGDAVLDGEVDRVQAVMLLGEAPPIAGIECQRLARGSRGRFTVGLLRGLKALKPTCVMFDHVGLARVAQLPGLRAMVVDYTVWVYGSELGERPNPAH